MRACFGSAGTARRAQQWGARTAQRARGHVRTRRLRVRVAYSSQPCSAIWRAGALAARHHATLWLGSSWSGCTPPRPCEPSYVLTASDDSKSCTHAGRLRPRRRDRQPCAAACPRDGHVDTVQRRGACLAQQATCSDAVIALGGGVSGRRQLGRHPIPTPAALPRAAAPAAGTTCACTHCTFQGSESVLACKRT